MNTAIEQERPASHFLGYANQELNCVSSIQQQNKTTNLLHLVFLFRFRAFILRI